jgi:2'-5' RNA ligase
MGASVAFTVQLDLDAGTDAEIAAIADRLARVVPDLETVRQIGDVHHVSLGVYDELPLDLVVPKLERFAERLTPLNLRLANVGIFPGDVIFFGPVVTDELLKLHRRFHVAFARFSGSCWANYHPGVWVPHVTVALNVRRVAIAVEQVMRDWKPVSAKLDALRLIEFRPVVTLFRADL